MPSSEHEGFIELFRNAPELLELHRRIPPPRISPEAKWVWQATSCSLTATSPIELRADAVFMRVQEGGTDPDLVVIVEVQRDRKENKRKSWPKYLNSAATRYDCAVLLYVVCPDAGVAAWASEALDLRIHGVSIVPIVLGPDDVPVILDPAQAVKDPLEMVLSAIMHGEHHKVRARLFRALAAAIDSLPVKMSRTYTEIVYNTVAPQARDDLKEAMMTVTAERRSIFTDLFNDGVAQGEAQSLLLVLESRGFEVTDSLRETVTSCTDTETLQRWLQRAATMPEGSDLLTEDPG